jgi:hypothetical protein
MAAGVFVRGQILEMDVIHVDAVCAIAFICPALPRNVNRLAEALPQALEDARKVEGAALFEFHDEFQLGVLRGDAATVDGLDDGFPFVCAEPGSGDARVCDVEDGDGEGLESGRRSGGEVDELGVAVSRRVRGGARGDGVRVCWSGRRCPTWTAVNTCL